MTDGLLHIRRLACGYGQRALIRAEELMLMPGEIALVSGRNGAGKSTFLRTLCHLLPALEGSVQIGGKDIHGLSPRELARKVAIVLTRRPEVAALPATTLVHMGRFPHGDQPADPFARPHPAAVQALEWMGMTRHAATPVGELSDGELQRIMIARVLCQETPLVLLDEPTAFLDAPSRNELVELLSRLAREAGKAIVFSSHDLGQARTIARQEWECADGAIAARMLHHG